ncbi:MAG: PIN domain-containing protein [Clostridia bacterium]|nr:PIN domain-containing protein [Clostridia bacterium]
MKILIDTNIILDVLAKRKPFYKSSANILRLSETEAVSGFITANSVTDIFFILRKHFTDKKELNDIMQKLLLIVDIADTLKSDIMQAFELEFNDYEDALQARCAKRIKAEYIITRNQTDVSVKLCTPIKFSRNTR